MEQRQGDTLALTPRAHRGDTGNGLAVFGDDDPLLGQILQQRQALAPELGDAQVSHTSSVHQNVQNCLRPPPHFGAGLGFGLAAVGGDLVGLVHQRAIVQLNGLGPPRNQRNIGGQSDRDSKHDALPPALIRGTTNRSSSRRKPGSPPITI